MLFGWLTSTSLGLTDAFTEPSVKHCCARFTALSGGSAPSFTPAREVHTSLDSGIAAFGGYFISFSIDFPAR